MAKNKRTDKPQDSKNVFGRKMKKIRGKQKLTQKALAEKSGMGISQISKYEKGIAFPTNSSLIKIARGLGVTVSELVPEKAYLDDPRFEPYRGDKISFRVGEEDKEDAKTAETNENNAPNISIYAPDNESKDDNDSSEPVVDNEHNENDNLKEPKSEEWSHEVYYGEKAKRLANTLIDASHGLSDDPFFIAAERLLLEAFFSYQFIESGNMLKFDIIEDMLLQSEPISFVDGEYGVTLIDEMFDDLALEYDGNFASETYEALKSHICVKPELKGIFLSCAERIRKTSEFINAVFDTIDFLDSLFQISHTEDI